MTRKYNRRQFLQAAGQAAAFALPVLIPAAALGRAGRIAPSERIVLGCIGVGNMGTADMNALMTIRSLGAIRPARPKADAGMTIGNAKVAARGRRLEKLPPVVLACHWSFSVARSAFVASVPRSVGCARHAHMFAGRIANPSYLAAAGAALRGNSPKISNS